MGVKEILSRQRDEILQIAARHGASNVRVFGSVARGEAGAESDLDLLVDLEHGRSLLGRYTFADVQIAPKEGSRCC